MSAEPPAQTGPSEYPPRAPRGTVASLLTAHLIGAVSEDIEVAQTRVPRCGAAFRKIGQSTDLLQKVAADSCEEFMVSGNVAAIDEKFVTLVSESAQYPPTVVAQFRRIIAYFRRRAGAHAAKHPKRPGGCTLCCGPSRQERGPDAANGPQASGDVEKGAPLGPSGPRDTRELSVSDGPEPEKEAPCAYRGTSKSARKRACARARGAQRSPAREAESAADEPSLVDELVATIARSEATISRNGAAVASAGATE